MRRWIPKISAVSSCTISLAWSSVTCSNAGTCDCTSTGTHTLTVPSGNSGTLVFSSDDSLHNAHTANQYSKNGGAFTTIAEGGTVVFANNDTIQLKLTAMVAAGGAVIMTVKDNTTGATIGTFQGENTHA